MKEDGSDLLTPIQNEEEYAVTQNRLELIKQTQLQRGFAEEDELERLTELIAILWIRKHA